MKHRMDLANSKQDLKKGMLACNKSLSERRLSSLSKTAIAYRWRLRYMAGTKVASRSTAMSKLACSKGCTAGGSLRLGGCDER